jgi:hypothetical protein
MISKVFWLSRVRIGITDLGQNAMTLVQIIHILKLILIHIFSNMFFVSTVRCLRTYIINLKILICVYKSRSLFKRSRR